MGNIRAIAGNVANTEKKYRFRLDGRNCIIIGENGSGKTSLLRDIYKQIESQIGRGMAAQNLIFRESIRTQRANLGKYPDQEDGFRSGIKHFRDSIRRSYDGCVVRFSDAQELIDSYKQHKAVLGFFSATRQSEIREVKHASAVEKINNTLHSSYVYGHDLEQHLVNMQVRAALSSQHDKSTSRFDEITKWLDAFNKNLKYLFEDESVEAVFNANELRYYIHQNGKPPFGFQSLSSGYSAIFGIYADLLVRTEYHNVIPSQLSGVILIDEIDAHLHISLQRKILPFFFQSFPNIQFIVSTHSPFVITSTNDSVIFDISKNRVSHDLSMYSIESIVEGLLGVPAISKSLEDKITHFVELTSRKPIPHKAHEIAAELSPYRDTMDSESRMHFELGLNKLLKTTKYGKPDV